MSKVFVTVRGYLNNPTIIIVDLLRKKEIERIEVDVDFPFNIENHKKGFSGICIEDNIVYCATWDRIVCLEESTLNKINEYTSPYFSDLHGIYKHKNILFVTSTNLSSLLALNLHTGKVSVVFSYTGFSIDKKTENDFRKLRKHDIPYYQEHLNSVHVNNKSIWISTLRLNRKLRLSEKLRLIRYEKPGSITKINIDTFEVENIVYNEGFHDPKFYDECLFYTQYFSNSLLKINVNTLHKNVISLGLEQQVNKRVTTRGMIKHHDVYYVGHNVKREYLRTMQSGFIGVYDSTGKKIDDNIVIKGVTGIYDIVIND